MDKKLALISYENNNNIFDEILRVGFGKVKRMQTLSLPHRHEEVIFEKFLSQK